MRTDSPVAYLATLAGTQGIPFEVRDSGNTLWLGAGTIQLPAPRIMWGGREAKLHELELPALTPIAAAIRHA